MRSPNDTEGISSRSQPTRLQVLIGKHLFDEHNYGIITACVYFLHFIQTKLKIALM